MRLEPYKTPGALAPECGRRHRRILLSVPVILHHLQPGGVRTSRGISLDLSESGIGALLPDTLLMGATVEIDLPLPEGPLTAIAIIRHTSNLRSGFEFVGLTPEERAGIVRVVGHG